MLAREGSSYIHERKHLFAISPKAAAYSKQAGNTICIPTKRGGLYSFARG
jgi:hypothetical protein